MYAVIETGGKQCKVSSGDFICVEKLDVNDDGEYVFDKVIAIGEGEDFKVGMPYLKGIKVLAKIIKTRKAKKIRVFTYKPKKNVSRTVGHRQWYTKLEIKEIVSEN